ncbi:MAG: GNAT family N-acetyltransferase [Myxococcota bacterium]
MPTMTLPSPIGPLQIKQQQDKIVSMQFDNEPHQSAVSSHCSLLQETAKQLQQYFAGHRFAFRLPLLPQGTPFYQRAWQALQQIGYGQTASYQQQALQLGSTKLARAVGRANACNPLPIVIPCHRVIGKSGHLTGYACGLQRKRYLLQLEADALKAIDFVPIQPQHLSRMHSWLNTPHVNRWWEHRPWSRQQVHNHYLSAQAPHNKNVDGFIIQMHQQPIGFIQRYSMPQHMPQADSAQLKQLQQHIDINSSAGVDLFIGETDWTGRGLGPLLLQQFLQQHIWPTYSTAVADPLRDNMRALSAYRQAGFDTLKHTHKQYKVCLMLAHPPST